MPNDKSDENDTGAQQARWMRQAHRMQTGVATMMSVDPSDTTPKHLRVGVNTALTDAGSLVRLLVAKGIITDAEYMKAIADGMEAEADAYERRVQMHFGDKVTIG